MMRLFSVNIGRAQPIEAARIEATGICKEPAQPPVQVSTSGLSGDVICDRRHHGGPDQAVYVYGIPDYAWWEQFLGRELSPGTFGENLSLTGLESARLAVGDRLRIGEVLLEITAPRIPCGTLAARMGDPDFVRRFVDAERPGAYCRVLREGALQAGMPVELEAYEGERVLVLELFRSFYSPAADEALLRRHLAAPIAQRARAIKERQLQALTNPPLSEQHLRLPSSLSNPEPRT